MRSPPGAIKILWAFASIPPRRTSLLRWRSRTSPTNKPQHPCWASSANWRRVPPPNSTNSSDDLLFPFRCFPSACGTSSLRCGVEWIVLRIFRGVLGARNIQVDDDRLLPAAHDHRLPRLVLSRIQLLMRHIRRDVYKISRARFIDELQIISPAKTRATAHYIDHGFELTMMMRAGLGIGMHNHGSRPKFFRARAGV